MQPNLIFVEGTSLFLLKYDFQFYIYNLYKTDRDCYNEQLQPYVDDPENYGLKVTDFEWLLNATLAADRSGLQVFSFSKVVFPVFLINYNSSLYLQDCNNIIQVAVHAIGDKANEMVLDLFNMVAISNGIRDRRFRVIYCILSEINS